MNTLSFLGRRATPFAARRLPLLAAAALLSGCVVVPQTREVYDEKCRMLTKEVVLETAVLGQFRGCNDKECALMLASMGVVTAATAVVSGSVAVVGNVVYWFERQGRCLTTAPAPQAPAFPAAASAPPATAPAASAAAVAR
jgi:hypothetical protein